MVEKPLLDVEEAELIIIRDLVSSISEKKNSPHFNQTDQFWRANFKTRNSEAHSIKYGRKFPDFHYYTKL